MLIGPAPDARMTLCTNAIPHRRAGASVLGVCPRLQRSRREIASTRWRRLSISAGSTAAIGGSSMHTR